MSVGVVWASGNFRFRMNVIHSELESHQKLSKIDLPYKMHRTSIKSF